MCDLSAHQVVKVEEAFQSVLQQVRSRLELKSKLHRKRILLQNLEHISLTLNKIEKLLGGEGSDVRYDQCTATQPMLYFTVISCTQSLISEF